ncbi:hypothetical protein Lgra_1292 [Legionella gratiana]|uniref:Uncharacterized protein n=1 Tax=Legionella gratiana TaxID=45066 RepID=A0A378JG19_9GAMM|nr:hypothetical protein [Legionella gratiana]KTD11834.1 hypothetical protein Lgra_1292 [Legionella gratiana]STX46575.1 Uncharacterised protein [Legionella gratiana]
MNTHKQELQMLLKNLDSILDEMKQVLVSTKPVPSNKKETPYFLTKNENSDVERILVKINKYKKLRKETKDSSNRELEVATLMDIFTNAENLVKNISERKDVSEYIEKGFFNSFSHISHEIQRLIA